MIQKLQFITVDNEHVSHSEQAKRAYDAGCKWVQLRMKSAQRDEIISEAKKIVPIAEKFGATLLINDHVDVACAIGAHGVHLGKNDISPLEAREILGKDAIIGGTANTLDDIVRLNALGVDYIGLGPFRFTTTKKNLSPTIGINGYERIFRELRLLNIEIPVVAIGGITIADIIPIIGAGAFGIALAGEVVKNEAIEENIKNILIQIKKSNNEIISYCR
jgi:thiamine-phosphate pyrophosphorylase